MGGSPEVDTSYQDWAISEAERTRAEETARQARIDEGLARIRAVFEGGTAGETVTPLDVTSEVTRGRAPVYNTRIQGDKAKNVIRTLVDPGVPDVTTWRVGDRAFTDEAAARAFASENAVRSGGQTFTGIEPLLDQREAAMKDYYLPELDKKRDDALEQLTYALSRAGLLTSSVAGEKQADLGDQYSLEKASILSKVAADRAGTKTALNQQRSSIEAGLRASGDASAATSQALSTTSGFAADQPEMNPLGDLFYGIASGIGAAKQGQQVAAVRKSMTPSPLRAGAGRNVA